MATPRTLELTIISATISPDAQVDAESRDTYATIRCAREQRCTKTTSDHGRSPVWNETFVFNLEDEDSPKFIFVQVFAVRPDTDELLGVARISIPRSGETEGSLHTLVSPNKGETGTLKAAWRWKSNAQQGLSTSSSRPSSVGYVTKDTEEQRQASYPHTASTYDDVTHAMSKLAVHKGQDKEPYPVSVYDAVSSGAYPPNYEVEERSSLTSAPYPPPTDLSKTSYPPAFSEVPTYPPNADAYPPYPEYHRPSMSSEESHFSAEKGKLPSDSTTRGIGDTKDKGHHSHMPYGYLPPTVYGGSYPPPPGYPSPYGPPPGSYPPAPAYPPAPHGVPPAPYGYPPAVNPYPPQPYPSYGYPQQAPYPIHPGHGSYAPGMYVGHSSSWKHSKHYKHHKMPKHSMYGHGQPHYPMHGHHYKHKKNNIFGKGRKFKKFKGFKKFKF